MKRYFMYKPIGRNARFTGMFCAYSQTLRDFFLFLMRIHLFSHHNSIIYTMNVQIVRSISVLLIGVLFLALGDSALGVLVMAVGALLMIPGVFALLAYVRHLEQRRMFPLAALGSFVLGLWMVVVPEFFVGFFVCHRGAAGSIGYISAGCTVCVEPDASSGVASLCVACISTVVGRICSLQSLQGCGYSLCADRPRLYIQCSKRYGGSTAYNQAKESKRSYDSAGRCGSG